MKTCVVRKRIPPYSGSVPINITDTINTPPGFGTPKFALFFFTNGSDNDTFDESSTNRIVGVGFVGLSSTDNTTYVQFSSYLGYRHNEANNSPLNKSVSGNSNSRFVYEVRLDRTVARQLIFTSFDVDKMNYFTAHSNTTTSNLDLICIFFTGSDVQANVGYLPLGLSNNTTASVTGLTFQPDLIFASGAGFGTAANNYDGRLSFGCATRFGSIKNSSLAFRMRNSTNVSVGTTVSEYYSNNRCFSIFSVNSTTAIATADVTSFNNDGFTVTSRATFSNGVTNHMIYMAIKGPTSNIFDLQNYTSSTSTGISGIATTDFIPSLVVGALGSVTSSNTETTSNNSTGYSLFAVKSLTSKSNYGPGTMSVTSGLTAVTGSGTAFSSLNPGDVIYNSTNSQIGTVSSFSNNTSLTLSSGASATMSSENYSVIPFGQFSVSIGSSNNATTTQVYSAINTNPFFVASYGSEATPTTLIKAKVNNFDSYPGLKINYETANSTARKGWFVAFKDNENRRRDIN
jgi:hypothetical protein